MTVYALNKFDITDPALFDDYATSTAPILARHGGRILVADKDVHSVEGPTPGMMVVVEFPTEQHFQSFYDDPEYRADKRHASTVGGNLILCPVIAGT